MSIKQKLTAGIVTAAMFASVMAPMSHAATVKVKGNGAWSKNVVAGLSVNVKKVNQGNFTMGNTAVVSGANTGGNKTNWNTGGTTSSGTGAATSKVTVSVTGGGNTATVPDCGCQNNGNHDVVVSGNGAGSTNVVLGADVNWTQVSQENATVANTFVVSGANTGNNQTNGNTGGGATTTTGNANSTVGVTVDGGNNVLN